MSKPRDTLRMTVGARTLAIILPSPVPRPAPLSFSPAPAYLFLTSTFFIRSVVSHILYGTVKITCYDRVQENVASASQGGHTPAAWGYPMQGQDFGSEGRGLGGGGGGGGGARWGETFFGQQPDLSVLRESAWHQAPHTSCLTPSKANVHQLEAGNHGGIFFCFLSHSTPRARMGWSVEVELYLLDPPVPPERTNIHEATSWAS